MEIVRSSVVETKQQYSECDAKFNAESNKILNTNKENPRPKFTTSFPVLLLAPKCIFQFLHRFFSSVTLFSPLQIHLQNFLHFVSDVSLRLKNAMCKSLCSHSATKLLNSNNSYLQQTKQKHGQPYSKNPEPLLCIPGQRPSYHVCASDFCFLFSARVLVLSFLVVFRFTFVFMFSRFALVAEWSAWMRLAKAQSCIKSTLARSSPQSQQLVRRLFSFSSFLLLQLILAWFAGFNVETVQYKRLNLQIWDIGMCFCVLVLISAALSACLNLLVCVCVVLFRRSAQDSPALETLLPKH